MFGPWGRLGLGATGRASPGVACVAEKGGGRRRHNILAARSLLTTSLIRKLHGFHVRYTPTRGTPLPPTPSLHDM